MSNIKKRIETEGASYKCKSLGDLLDTFEVKLSYFMNEKKRSFPLSSDEYCVFNQYLTVDYCENTLHVFNGESEESKIEYILDTRHQRIYGITENNDELVLKEYDFDGEMLNSIETLSDLSIEDIIEKYLKRDYFCYDVGELLRAFNLDFDLSDKLKGHVIMEREGETCDYCCGHRITFSDYNVKIFGGREFFVFESMFDNDTIVFDSEPPVYYLDPERQFLYVETRGMVGICILQFNEDNEIVKDAHSWIVDFEMFLELTD